MVHGIKANPKSSNFQRILSLPAPGDLLNSIPVLNSEHRIIVDIQRRTCNAGECIKLRWNHKLFFNPWSLFTERSEQTVSSRTLKYR